MLRLPRIHVPGAFYHVLMKGNVAQPRIFPSDDHQFHFLRLLAEGVARFHHCIHAYCLLSDQIDLLIQVGDIPLSKIMQHLGFRYTRWFNRREQRSGHLFQGRFKAVLIDAEVYLAKLVRHIHLAPVRAGIAKTPGEYDWSSHRAYLGLVETPWLTTERVLFAVTHDAANAREHFAAYVEDGMCEERREDFFPKAAPKHILGDDRFIETSLRLADPSPFSVRLESIITAVCAARTLDLPTLSAAGRGHRASEARALIAYLALEKRAGTLTMLARLLNRDVSTLSNAATRIRQRIKTESELAREVDRLTSLLEIGRTMRKRTTTKA